jgi:hypothetical protein
MGRLGASWIAGLVLAGAIGAPAAAQERACARGEFEAVVEEAAAGLRDLNTKNKPTFQDKLRQLKTKRGWDNDQFLKEAAPFVRDDKIAEFDVKSDELLTAIASMGEEGANAKAPDCALLLELRARMKVLVETQNKKWTYMFEKLESELWK